MERLRLTRSAIRSPPGTIDNRGEGEWTSMGGTPAPAEERETLLNRSERRQNGYGSAHDDEEASPHKSQKALNRMALVKDHLNATVTASWVDLILLACFFIAGLIDSGAYNAYEVFTSMQTGNTVFAALGVSDLPISAPKGAYLKSLTSIVSFLMGAMVFGTVHRYFGPRRRWVLMWSFATQAVAVIVAAEMVRLGKSSDSPAKDPSILLQEGKENFPGFPLLDLIPIALLSFQAAPKVVLSRVMQYSALPTIVLTTLYNDLMADPGLWSAGLFANPQRNRRAAGVVVYFAGAVLGGRFASSRFGFVGALYAAGICELLIMGAWAFWFEEQEDDSE